MVGDLHSRNGATWAIPPATLPSRVGVANTPAPGLPGSSSLTQS